MKRENLSIYIAFAIPVFMVILVLLSIYLPGIFMKPKNTFLYVISHSYGMQAEYIVEDGKVIENDKYVLEADSFIAVNNFKPKIYFYDVDLGEARELTFKEAIKFDLDPSLKSSDGFGFTYNSYFVGSTFYKELLLKNSYTSKKVNIPESEINLNFIFLGWVK
ncbi:MAG: hypothetical protein GQ527_03660 [Bacteroidales bacterium]|nr:hypothetical protein [Bacteroidales bacterium]